jgi:hypothetical protein
VTGEDIEGNATGSGSRQSECGGCRQNQKM